MKDSTLDLLGWVTVQVLYVQVLYENASWFCVYSVYDMTKSLA